MAAMNAPTPPLVIYLRTNYLYLATILIACKSLLAEFSIRLSKDIPAARALRASLRYGEYVALLWSPDHALASQGPLLPARGAAAGQHQPHHFPSDFFFSPLALV